MNTDNTELEPRQSRGRGLSKYKRDKLINMILDLQELRQYDKEELQRKRLDLKAQQQDNLNIQHKLEKSSAAYLAYEASGTVSVTLPIYDNPGSGNQQDYLI